MLFLLLALISSYSIYIAPIDEEGYSDYDLYYDYDGTQAVFESALISVLDGIPSTDKSLEIVFITDWDISEASLPIDLGLFTTRQFTKINVYMEYGSSIDINLYFNSANDYSNFELEIGDSVNLVETQGNTDVTLNLGGFTISSNTWTIKSSSTTIQSVIINTKYISANFNNLNSITNIFLTDSAQSRLTIPTRVDMTIDLNSDSVSIASSSKSISVSTNTGASILCRCSTYSSNNGKITLNVGETIDYSKYPALMFQHFTGITQTGSFTTPPENIECFRFESSAITVLSLDSTIIPINFQLAAIPEIVLTKDITFLYDFICTTLALKNEGTSLYTVKISNIFRGNIKIFSPFIKLEIEEYNLGYSTSFPIPAFNEISISLVEVNKLTKSSSSWSPPNSVDVISCITQFLNDAALISNGFDSGKSFFSVVEGQLTYATGSVSYSSDDIPEASKSIHGFNSFDNCLSIITKTEGNKQLFCIKSSPVSEIIRRVQYGTCSYDRAALKVEAESDFSNLVGSGILPSGHNLLTIILCEELTADFDLSTLDESITNLELTIEASTYSNKFQCDFRFSDGQTTVKLLSLIRTKFTKSQKLECLSISFDTVDFANKDLEITFIPNSQVTMDSDTIYLMKSGTRFYDLVVVSDSAIWTTSTSTITIKDTMFSLTYLTQEPYDLPYDKVDNLVLRSARGETFRVVFDDSLKTEERTLKPFKIEVTRATTVKVTGDSSLVTYPSKIIVDHSTFPLEVTYTRPDQGAHFYSEGTGTVSEILEYENPYTLCVYRTDNTKCPADADATTTVDELATTMTNLKNTEDIFNINLKIADSTVSDSFLIPVDLFDSILCLVDPCDDTGIAYIELEQTTGVSRIYVTSTTFTKANIKVKAEIESLQFGELHFNDCSFDTSCKSTELRADDIFCLYSVLIYWSQLTISDNLRLTGTIPTDPTQATNIHFTPDENANDLVAEISGVSTFDLAINPGTLNMGALTFYISRSRNYDALLNLVDTAGTDGITLNINCQSNVPINEMPKITIDGANALSEKAKFVFSGEWQDYYTEDVVQTINIPQVTLELSDIVPFRAVISKSVEIIATTHDTGITGPIELTQYRQGNQPTAVFVSTKVTNERTKVYIMNGIILPSTAGSYRTYIVEAQSSMVDITIDKISSESGSKVQTPVKLLMDEHGISTVEIKEVNDAININQTIRIVNSLQTDYDEESIQLLKQEWNVLCAPRDLVHQSEISFEYEMTTSVPHGFTNSNNVMESKIQDDGNMANFVIYSTKLPSTLPFIFEYGRNTGTAEYFISEANVDEMNDLSGHVPSKINDITIGILSAMPEGKPLNLLPFDGKAKHVTIHGDSNRQVNLIFPSQKTMSVTISAGLVTLLTANADVGIDALTLTDCDFTVSSVALNENNINKLSTDVDSMNALIRRGVMSSYSSPIKIEAANIINFTSNGWSVIELSHRDRTTEIKSADFPDVSFNALDTLSLLIEPGLRTIKPLKLNYTYSSTLYLEISLASGWSEITNARDWSLDTGDATVKVTLPFYPLPDIFSRPTTDFEIVFNNPAEDPSPDIDVAIRRDYVYSESRIFNMLDLESLKQVVRAPSITFVGQNAKLDFVDDVGELRITEAVVLNRTYVQLGKTEINSKLTMYQQADMYGMIGFTRDANVEMHWRTTTSPRVSITSQIRSTPPNEIRMVFGNETIDNQYFNDHYYRWQYEIIVGSFDCQSFLSRVTFVSQNPYFNSNSGENVMEAFCTGDSHSSRLVMWANKLLPVAGTSESVGPDSGDQDDNRPKMSTGAISGITIGAIVIVAVVVGVVVYMFTRKKYEALLNTEPIDDKVGGQTYMEDL